MMTTMTSWMPSLKPSDMGYSQFAELGYLKGEAKFKKYKSGGFKTPTGKVELCLSTAEKFGLRPLPEYVQQPQDNPEYPLVLTSSKNPYYMHSSYRWVERLRKKSPEPLAEIHPKTASRLGIGEGARVIIATKQGQITQTAHLTESVHPDVINASYGWWFPEEDITLQDNWTKSNLNILTSVDELGKEFGTPISMVSPVGLINTCLSSEA